MSDIADQSGSVDPDLGQVASDDQQTAPVEPTPEPWGDFDNYADQLVEIQVGGEPQYVPLAELRNGYQRQADYTQKTQSLAEERAALAKAEKLWRALDDDPAGTLRLLQTAFEQELQGNQPDPEDEFLTDEQRQLKQLQEQLDQFRKDQEFSQVSAQLDAELSSLVDQHGLDDAGRQALIDFAVERDYPNFTDAYARMKYESHSAVLAAEQAQQARRAAAQQAQVVNGAASRNPAAQPSPQPRVGQSVEDSFRQAYEALTRQ